MEWAPVSGFSGWTTHPWGPVCGTHMKEAVEDGLEDQQIGRVGAPRRALLGALLISFFVVGVLIILLGHPGPQRRQGSPQPNLY